MIFKYKFAKNYLGNKENDLFFAIKNSSYAESEIFASDIDRTNLECIPICEGCEEESCECKDFVTSSCGKVRRYEILSREEVILE